MIAFHGDAALKTFLLDRIAEHREAGKLVKGLYYEKGKGCAIGCTLEAVRLWRGADRIDHGNHALYEQELGIPKYLAYPKDELFERLPNEESQRWPERFITATPVSADLTLVWPKYALCMLRELPQLVNAKRFPQVHGALAEVAALYHEWIESGKTPAKFRWIAARNKTTSSFGDGSPYANTDVIYDAYDAAVAAADAYVALTDAAQHQANKLIELLAAAVEK